MSPSQEFTVVIQPEFLKVLPADVARVGVLGALTIALVRYATALPSEKNGRILIDGLMWWRASHAEIGEALGALPGDTARRAVGKLCTAGELRSVPARAFPGDRALAYRVPDQPLRETAESVDQPLRESAEWGDQPFRTSAEPIPHIRRTHSADLRNAPISTELEEGGEGPPSNLAPPTPPKHGRFGPRCRKHQEVKEPGKCGDCGDVRDAHREELATYETARNAWRAEVTHAIDNCPDCDSYGRLDDLSECRKHPNHRRGGISA